jgi:hypothetical protein
MAEKKVYFNRRMVVMMLMVTGGCFSVLAFTLGQSTGPGRAMNLMGMVLMGAIFLLILNKLVANRPAIVINSEGFWDGTSLKGAGLVRWAEIEEIRLYLYLGKKVMGIVPKDKDQFLGRLSYLKRNLLLLNLRLGYPLINIAEQALDASLEEMVKFIEDNRFFGGRVERL